MMNSIDGNSMLSCFNNRHPKRKRGISGISSLTRRVTKQGQFVPAAPGERPDGLQAIDLVSRNRASVRAPSLVVQYGSAFRHHLGSWASKVPKSTACSRRAATVRGRRSRGAFTLAEMLIAMAVTLLMMAALAKSFGLIGESVRDGRAKVELTAVARDVTLRINDELSRCTVPLTPPTTENSGAGYFLYYEGPLTDATSALLGRRADPTVTDDPTNFLDTRYGDLDDYLAFTAVAADGHWFRGKVPRFVLDQKTAEMNGNAYDPTNFPGAPNDPIMITSKYAEIIYFASPEYATSVSQAGTIYNYANDAEGNPIYVDAEGNGLPDRVQLHRRVLLIRPDLNLNNPGGTRADLSLSADDIALGSFLPPLPYDNNGNDPLVEYLAPDTWDSDNSSGVIPSIKTIAGHGISVEQFANAWLIGMAPVHQQCDLSVRRVTDRRGRPTNRIAANSLGDLTKPENRFAHVRMPGDRFVSGGNTYTSMPLLALGRTPPILAANVPASPPPPPPVIPAAGGVVVTPSRMNGFLRPEFVLGQDYTHTDLLGDGWGLDRMGEDILATNVLGFDVKAFDPRVRSYITSGENGVFVAPGEEGSTSSDDVLVTPRDLAFREALAGVGPVTSGQRGGFVDLFYPFNAGGTVRGIGTRRSGVGGTGPTIVNEPVFRGQLDTPMSGLTNAFQLPNTANAFYSRGLYKSGRMITAQNRNVILMQPAYDTYTDHYERDGFLQTFPEFNGGSRFGTVWYFNEADGTVPTVYTRDPDLGSNGIDDGGAFGADDALERETEPPFDSPLRAVRVSVRLENPATRQIQQMSSVREFVE